MTAAAVVVVVVTEEAVGAVSHIAAAAVVGLAVVTCLALVSGRQDRCKALCSCLGPSSKPCLRGAWNLTCSKGNPNS